MLVDIQLDDDRALLHALADRQAITDLVFRYCRSVDRLDVPLGRSVFHADSHADYGDDVYQGPGHGLVEWICEAHLGLTSHSHQVANLLIELDGDRAASEAYFTATMRLESDGADLQIFVRGRYLDAWHKRAGSWGITRREVAYDHDEVREVTSRRGPSRTARDRTDPSYRFLPARP